MSTKLDFGNKHVLRLIRRDVKPDGWTSVSEQLYAVLCQSVPQELAEFEKLEVGGRVRLTQAGNEVVNAMEWL